MKRRLVTLGFLLLLAVALPVSLVEVERRTGWFRDALSRSFGPSPAPSRPTTTLPQPLEVPDEVPPERPTSPVSTEPSSPAPSNDEPSVRPDPGVGPHPEPRALVRGPRWLIHGELTLSSQLRGADRRLTLRTPAGDRPIWTGSGGEFSFALTGEHFPAFLDEGNGPVLAFEEPPDDPSVFVNVHLVELRNPDRAIFLPRSITAMRGRDDIRIRALGSTRVPAGNRVVFRLLGGGDKVLEGSLFDVREEGELGEVVLPGVEYFSGRYKVVFEWKPHSASPSDLDQIRMYLPPEIPGVIRRPYTFYMGKRSEEAVQKAAIDAYYGTAISECLAGRDVIRWVAAEAKGEDTPLKESRRALLQTLDLFDGVRGIGRRGDFRLDQWRRFIDEELPARWRVHLDVSQVPYPAKHPVLKQNLGLALQTLNKYARLESRLIYRSLGKPPHANDYVDIDTGLESDRNLAHRRLSKFIRDMKRELR